MKINLKNFEKSFLQNVEALEFDPEKKYLIMVNVASYNYTEGFLKQLGEINQAFVNAGIKSIILVNPNTGGVQEYVIGQDKEIGSDEK